MMYKLVIDFGGYIPVIVAYRRTWPYRGWPYDDWEPANWFTYVVLPQPMGEAT